MPEQAEPPKPERGFDALPAAPVIIKGLWIMQPLSQFHAGRGLPSMKKSSDEFAFAADDQAGKSFKPFSRGNLRLLSEPVGQQSKLVNADLAALDALQQMIPQPSRKSLSTNARHD